MPKHRERNTMKITSTIIMAVILSAFTLTAQADAGFYAGVNYSKINYEESYGDLDFATLGGILGYNLSSTFGVEVRYARGQSGDDIEGYSVKIDNTVSVLGRLSLQNDTNLTPYVVAGYTRGELDIEGYGSDSTSDFSYGAGVGFELTKGLSAGVEYMVLIDKDSYEFNALSASLIYAF